MKAIKEAIKRAESDNRTVLTRDGAKPMYEFTPDELLHLLSLVAADAVDFTYRTCKRKPYLSYDAVLKQFTDQLKEQI